MKHKAHSKDKGNRGVFWIYGYHAVTSALRNSRRQRLQFMALKNSAAEFESFAPRIVSREELEKVLPKGAVHQGLALQVQPLEDSLDGILEEVRNLPRATVVVLDRVSDPHNVGAVLRSCAAFDVAAVIIPADNAPAENGAIAKAACGGMDIVPLIRTVNISQALKLLKEAGFWCIGMDSHTDRPLDKSDFPGKAAFVFGSEGEGMRRLTRENCDYLVMLNMSGQMESLNLSNAVAITLYERFNQCLD